uniref:Kazal-like domain-containing protein n=1 Tax=Tetraselmis sp. GSL018 TaxID=582737 RepID=A0A061RYD0_9CHLO|mmetsp:Transcript_11197/g.26560  ORF Transcript_11197/g.26560 Transcript_11197/m.26560 type:complete len:464 (+) Transcript_11197:154-1545(+)|eukprot:CAMPEP_0177614108 /NCGR_PEP_ID=MMETSP0419_2-20121207/22440_1 /TAXON_ID=582737 /ORGANISM="Tetraselmis sp., Strain GSL018" /LENGTH=463 /DNA_ID=CAMNT_0019111065 /DNA_START=56 /DNA_END=1447 /DNA_ORIENTATION=-
MDNGNQILEATVILVGVFAAQFVCAAEKDFPDLSKNQTKKEGLARCLCGTFVQPVCSPDGVTYSNTCWAKCAGFAESQLTNGECGKKPDLFPETKPSLCGHITDCVHLSSPANLDEDAFPICGWCRTQDDPQTGFPIPCSQSRVNETSCIPMEECVGEWILDNRHCFTEEITNLSPTSTESSAAVADEYVPSLSVQSQTSNSTNSVNASSVASSMVGLAVQKTSTLSDSRRVFESNGYQSRFDVNKTTYQLAGTVESCEYCLEEAADLVCSTTGTTLRNMCELQCRGLELKHSGDCFSSSNPPKAMTRWQAVCLAYCRANGVFAASGRVCGNDRNMYFSACEAHCFQVEVLSSQPCECLCTKEENVVSEGGHLVQVDFSGCSHAGDDSWCYTAGPCASAAAKPVLLKLDSGELIPDTIRMRDCVLNGDNEPRRGGNGEAAGAAGETDRSRRELQKPLQGQPGD